MKLRQHQFSIQPRIFEGSTYNHPWYQHIAKENGCVRKSDQAMPVKYRIAEDCPEDMKEHAYNLLLNRPNPPSKEAVERAKFVDKTYEWQGRTNSVRSGD